MNTKKNILKEEKGITLIALVITIIVLVIITTVGVHTSLERLKGNNVNKLFNDIEFLEDKTLEYYVANGELPILTNIDYPNISAAGENAINLKIIDLSKLGNLSLNFGQDFEKLKNETKIENTDYNVYVINEQTQQIFYSKGITANKITYYTKDNRDVQILTSGDDKIVLDVKGEKIDQTETGKDEETNINYYEDGIDSYYCTVKVRYKIVKNKLNNDNLKVDIYYGETNDNITTLKESIEPGIKELSDAGYYEIKLGSTSLIKFKLTHKWRAWSTKQEKIYCTDTGKNIRTCEKCGTEKEQEIQPVEHEWGEWTIKKQATCKEEGIQIRTCKKCKKEMEQSIPLTDHQWGEWETVEIIDGDYLITDKRTCKVCQAEETKRIPLVSKQESKVGYYADIDKDGTVDGVIYADLAQGGSGQWSSDSRGAYTIPKVTEGLKAYYVSKENYTDKFGTKDVLSPVGQGTGRFYVMALADIDNQTNKENYYWYYNAVGDIEDENISTEFGKGLDNTKLMITNYDRDTKKYGAHKSNDVWKFLHDKYTNADDVQWFLPSSEELAAFAGQLGISSKNYSRLWS